MCGRARCSSEQFGKVWNRLARKPATENIIDHSDKPYIHENFSPGQECHIICQEKSSAQSRCVKLMTWGLIPKSTHRNSKVDHFLMFNCRVESVFEKKSFKGLLESNRCVVVFDGFYEWKLEAGKKQPYYIYNESLEPLIVAGMHDEYLGMDGTVLVTFTALTCHSCTKLRWLHDRQPVVLDLQDVADWLNPLKNADELIQRLSSEAHIEQLSAEVSFHPVTRKMNSLSYKGSDCSTPLRKTEPISNFFQKSPPNTPTPASHNFSKKSPDISPSSNSRDNFVDGGSKSDMDVKSITGIEAPRSTVEQTLVTPVCNASDQQVVHVHNIESPVETIECPLCCMDISEMDVDNRNRHASSCDGGSSAQSAQEEEMPSQLKQASRFMTSRPHGGDLALCSNDRKRKLSRSPDRRKVTEKSGGKAAHVKPAGSAAKSASPTSGDKKSITSYFQPKPVVLDDLS